LIRATRPRPEFATTSPLLLQSWQLLALVLPVFLPSAFFLAYLRSHLAQNALVSGEVGVMVRYCSALLDLHLRHGGRMRAPSRVEVDCDICLLM
jgi:hypothetical protein